MLECIAKLALTGRLRPVRGILPAALAARDSNRAIVTANGDDVEAALVSGLQVYAGTTLNAVCRHLNDVERMPNTAFIATHNHASPEAGYPRPISR